MFLAEQKKQFPGGVQKSGGDQKGGLKAGQEALGDNGKQNHRGIMKMAN